MGRRHSYHCDGVFGNEPSAAEEMAKQYIENSHRRMSQPITPLAAEASELDPISPAKKKKKKPKERRKNSKQRGKGDRDASVGTEGNSGSNSGRQSGGNGEVGSPLVSPTGKDSKKKKRPKKCRYSSEELGVVIIPDCEGGSADDDHDDDGHYDEREVADKSAHFSTVTDPTQILDDDDFTAMTKDTKETKDDSKKFSKSPKTTRKNFLTLTKEPKDTMEEKYPKSPKSPRKTKKSVKEKRSKSEEKGKKMPEEKPKTKPVTKNKMRRSSITKDDSTKNNTTNSNANETWGTDPKGNKAFMAPELMNLLMDPAMEIDDSDHGKPPTGKEKPSLQKSNSFSGPKRTPSQKARRGSFGNLGAQMKNRERPTRSKRFQDATNVTDTKNESWGTAPLNGNPKRRTSYSPELLNLYTSPKKGQKPSPLMRRNVKSFNSVNESWKTDPNRDSGIPSILFLSPENAHCNLNESWSSRQFERSSSFVRGKETISGNANGEEPMRARSSGPHRRRSSARDNPKPLRKKGPPMSNRNESWDVDPRNCSGKSAPLSPGLIEILGMSPSARKSTGRLRKKLSLGMSNSPSLNSLKNSFNKLRGGKSEKSLNQIPIL